MYNKVAVVTNKTPTILALELRELAITPSQNPTPHTLFCMISQMS